MLGASSSEEEDDEYMGEEEEEENENEQDEIDSEDWNWLSDDEEGWGRRPQRRRSFTKKTQPDRPVLHAPLPRLEYPPSNGADVFTQLPSQLALDVLVRVVL